MSWLVVTVIAIGLAMDAFAVSVAAGLVLEKVTFRHVFRIAFHFGLFQFMMPVIGWLAGRTVAPYIEACDHWIAFILLAGIGCKMLVEAFSGREKDPAKDPTRGWVLIALSVATSIDALAVGLSLAFLNVPIWFPSIIIGVVAGVSSAIGVLFGGFIGPRWSRWVEVFGGLVLIAIGVKILIEHTCA